MRRKKWNNWRETKTGLFVFLFFSPTFFPLRHEQKWQRESSNFVQKSAESDDK
jgi:hypothetical protein